MAAAENEQETARLFPFMQRAQAFMDTPDEDKTEALCLEAVRLDGRLFRHVPETLKTPAVCLEAVRSWAGVLRDVPPAMATQEMYLEAVRQNAFVLDDVPPGARTPEVCLAAVRTAGYALWLVPEELKTEELCLEAFLGGAFLGAVPERLRTPEFCLKAFRRDAGTPEGAALAPEVCLAAVRQKPERLHLLPEEMRTPELCLAAVQNDGMALRFVPEDRRTPELCAEAVQMQSGALEFVPEALKTPELCMAAIRYCGEAIRSVPEALKTPELCLAAAKNDGWALKYVPEDLKTEEICLAAARRTARALEFVPEPLKTEKVLEAAAKRQKAQAFPFRPRLPFAVPVSRGELEASVRSAIPNLPEGAESSALLLQEDGSAVPLPDEGPVLARRLFLPLLVRGRGTGIVLHSVLAGTSAKYTVVQYAESNFAAIDLMRAGGIDVNDDARQDSEAVEDAPVPVLDRDAACAVFAAKIRADLPGLDSLVRRVNALLGGRLASGPANLRALLPGHSASTACVVSGRSVPALARAAGLPEGTAPICVNSAWHAEHPGRLLTTWLHETVHLLLPNGVGHCRRFWIWLGMLAVLAGRSGLFSQRLGGGRWGSPRRGASLALAWIGEDGGEKEIARALAEYRRMPRAPIRDPAVRRLASRKERIAASRRRAATAAVWRLVR